MNTDRYWILMPLLFGLLAPAVVPAQTQAPVHPLVQIAAPSESLQETQA